MEKTYYEGSQWLVTDYGIEERGGTGYHIPKEDFGMDVGEGGWVGHMSEKPWVDIEDFKRALAVAKRINS